MLSQPELNLRDLPFIIYIASTPLFDGVYLLSHPFLGKESL